MLRIFPVLLAVSLMSGCSLWPFADSDANNSPVRLGPAVTPLSYRLDFTAIPGQTYANGRVEIAVKLAQPQQRIALNARNIEVASARFIDAQGNSWPAEFQQLDRYGRAELRFDEIIPAGSGSLDISYQARLSDALESIYKVREQDRDYLFSQFQTSSARLLFPSFDEPGFKTPFTISVTTAADQTVVGNMPALRSIDLANGLKRVEFATSPPMPTYLLAFAIGPLDVVPWKDIAANAIRKTPIPLRGIAAHSKGDQMRYALEHTEDLLLELERYFGTPYPYPKLDLIAAPDFHAGAMENIGAIVYREYFLLHGEDAPLHQRRNYAIVHAHEMAHQWFGNLVTPKWWDDTWLNESFASWLSYKTADGWDPDGDYERQTQHRALHAMNLDSLASARQVRQPIESNDDITNAFDGITYSKGGGVLAMFENYLGEEAFREGVRTHMQRFAGGNADADDFMQSLSIGSGNEGVVPAFSSFIYQAGVPEVDVALSCDEQPTLQVRQRRYRPLGSQIQDQYNWQIPFCVRSVSENGLSRSCHLLRQPEQTLPLQAAQCPQAIMPNADGAGYYRFALSTEAWQTLIAHSAQLSAAELLSLSDSLAAAFHAGTVDFKVLLQAAEALATHPEWDVATALLKPLTALHDRLMDESSAAGLRHWLIQLYAERLETLGLDQAKDEQPGQTLLRQALVKALALTAQQAPLRKELEQRALQWLGNPEKPSFRPGMMAPDIIPTALKVAVDEDPQLGRQLLAALGQTTDSIARDAIVRAIAGSKMLADTARELVPSDTIRDNEVRKILGTQASNPKLRDELWDWMQNHFETLLARTPDWGQGALIRYNAQFCDLRRAEEVTEFFQPKLAALTGSPRHLAATLESIKLCASLKKARLPQIQEALQ